MMWFSNAVLASQIVVLYALAAPAALRALYAAARARNPDWLTVHPELAGRLDPRRAVALSLAACAAWLTTLGLLAAGADAGDLTGGRDWRIALLIASMLGWIALEWLAAALLQRRVLARIPAPARRRASLSPRTLAAFAHPFIIAPGLLMLVLLAALYLRAWASGAVDTPVAVWRLLSLCGGAALWALALRHCVRRKPQADAWADDWQRRAEVRGCIACLYLFALAAGWRALQDLSGVYLPGELDFFSWASVLLQAVLLLWLVRSHLLRPTHKKVLPNE
jgi:hypothetical protein